MKGISIDNKINSQEIEALLGWCSAHEAVKKKSPFNELIPAIKKAAIDGVIDEIEKEDLLWLCHQYISPNRYFDQVTSDMQRLQGVLAGIAADGKITEVELINLRSWLEDFEHLRTIWPFDEIDALILDIMSDGIIDEKEHDLLLGFCDQFLTKDNSVLMASPVGKEMILSGICSADPVIVFQEKSFCLSGTFENGFKEDVAHTLKGLGATVLKREKQTLDYLVVGAKGNPCWAFSCYGRKVEAVMRFRKEKGLPIQVIHEFDLFDAIEDMK